VPQDHPRRALRNMTEEALRELEPRFRKLYAKTGRPSIAPEKLLRALLLQALYSVLSERLLMEQLDYNLLFRWFVGLNMDDAIGDVTVFTKKPRAPARWGILPWISSMLVDAPESDQSRCSATDRACVRDGCRLIAASSIDKLLHSFKCKFPLTSLVASC
jgi:hypothetical protein